MVMVLMATYQGKQYLEQQLDSILAQTVPVKILISDDGSDDGTREMLNDYARDYWTGTVYTTNRRIWEHDEEFKEYLKKTRAMAVDMETATLFSCGFANHIPTGALLLVSDQPMIPEGVKTDKSDNLVTQNYVKEHVEIGIASLRMIIDEKKTVKHLKFDW